MNCPARQNGGLFHGFAHQRPEGYPSGQRRKTVNLLAYAFGGSNQPPSTNRFRMSRESFTGRTSAFQADGAGSLPVSRSIHALPFTSTQHEPLSIPHLAPTHQLTD